MTLDKKIIYLLLFLFHILLSWTFNSISYSDFLPSLHNGEGFWFFAADSLKYHNEAIIQLEYLKNSDWISWFYSFKSHTNVKVISLSYWILGNPSPISVSIVNALIWLVSIVLIFRSSQLIFPKNFFLPFLISTFFFHPSILMQSTQLLRDPYLILGVCCFIYGWVILEKNYSRWRWLFYTLLGFVLTVSMRQYLFPIFAISTLIYMPWVVYHKRWMMFPFAILVIFLALFQFSDRDTRTPSNITLALEQNKVLTLNAEVLEEKILKLRKRILVTPIEEFDNEEFKAFQDAQLQVIENLSSESDQVSSNLEFINLLEKKYDFLSKTIDQDISQEVTIENKSVLLSKTIDQDISQEVTIENKSDLMSRTIDQDISQERTSVVNNFMVEVNIELDRMNVPIDKENTEEIAYDQLSYWEKIEHDTADNFPPLLHTGIPVLDFANVLANHIGAIRYDWIRVIVTAGNYGSVIDAHVPIYDFYSVLTYLPRAIQIGFLAPFPKDFLTSGGSVGRIGYILSCAEMLLWYFIFFGFFYSLFVNLSVFRQLIPVFIFSVSIIILLAYVVPVIGALFRMRQGYMIPFYIYGMYGLQLLYNRFPMRLFDNKY